MNDEKLLSSFALLGEALDASAAEPDDALGQAALAKTFESTFEYVWKYFKREADQAGLETYSPRDALKSAAQLRLIDDLELWNQFLNARNLSVHDYVGLDQAATVDLVRQFRHQVKQLIVGLDELL